MLLAWGDDWGLLAGGDTDRVGDLASVSLVAPRPSRSGGDSRGLLAGGETDRVGDFGLVSFVAPRPARFAGEVSMISLEL